MKSKLLQKGFTLVELLIVIALISILSVAVLATINPIEQSNKARDAKFKNDAAELLGAQERYYAAKEGYAWAIGTGATVTSNWAGTIAAQSTLAGICGNDTCSAFDDLISSDELKTSFAAKAPFLSAAKEEERMYLNTDGGSNVHVCYRPKAKANKLNNSKLICLTNLGAGSSYVVIGAGCSAPLDSSSEWTAPVPAAASAVFTCVPE